MFGFLFGKLRTTPLESPAEQAGGLPQGKPADKKQGRQFRVRCGGVPGVDHQLARINNQDSLILRQLVLGDKTYVVGLVSDGCTGEKKQSRTEVGSATLTLYAFSEIRMLLSLGVSLAEIPKTLYSRCVSYIGNQARMTVAGSPEEMVWFVQNYFLCTLRGFIMDDKQLVTFSAGDGLFLVNDQDILTDQNDAPLYMGYHLIDRRFLPPDIELPQSFDTTVYDDVDCLTRFAVGTDGLIQRDRDSGRLFIDPAEREAIFSHKPKAQAGLQWWLNIQQSEHQRFGDDTSLITVEAIDVDSAEAKAEADSASNPSDGAPDDKETGASSPG